MKFRSHKERREYWLSAEAEWAVSTGRIQREKFLRERIDAILEVCACETPPDILRRSISTRCGPAEMLFFLSVDPGKNLTRALFVPSIGARALAFTTWLDVVCVSDFAEAITALSDERNFFHSSVRENDLSQLS